MQYERHSNYIRYFFKGVDFSIEDYGEEYLYNKIHFKRPKQKLFEATRPMMHKLIKTIMEKFRYS